MHLSEQGNLDPLVETHPLGRPESFVGDRPALGDVRDVAGIVIDVEHAGQHPVRARTRHGEQTEALLGG
jgi:hypothetical protein